MAVSDDRARTAERPPSLSPPDDVVAMLRVALDGLPAHQQAALRLAVTERLTVPDIASRLNATRTEVLDAMRDGLGSLRDVLDVVDPGLASGFAERSAASTANDREQT